MKNSAPDLIPASANSASALPFVSGKNALSVGLALTGIAIGLAAVSLAAGVLPVNQATAPFFAAIPLLVCTSFVCITLSQRSGQTRNADSATGDVLASVENAGAKKAPKRLAA